SRGVAPPWIDFENRLEAVEPPQIDFKNCLEGVRPPRSRFFECWEGVRPPLGKQPGAPSMFRSGSQDFLIGFNPCLHGTRVASVQHKPPNEGSHPARRGAAWVRGRARR